MNEDSKTELCKCGHAQDLHHHDRSCTGLSDLGKLKFCKCEEFRAVDQVSQIQEGEEMAKKKKSGSKSSKSTKKRATGLPRGEKLYEAFSSKIEASKYAKKVADKDTKFHTPLVARVLMSFEKPVSLERIMTAAKNSGYESDNVERCVRGDLAILVREGLAKATVIEMPKREKKAKSSKSSTANGAAKPKKRKAKAAKKRTGSEESYAQEYNGQIDKGDLNDATDAA